MVDPEKLMGARNRTPRAETADPVPTRRETVDGRISVFVMATSMGTVAPVCQTNPPSMVELSIWIECFPARMMESISSPSMRTPVTGAPALASDNASSRALPVIGVFPAPRVGLS